MNGDPIKPEVIPERRGSSERAMHTWGSGFTDWGACIGIDFNCNPQNEYGLYDASAYDGIKFWARSRENEVSLSIEVRIGSAPSTLRKYGGTCVENCNPASTTRILTNDWNQYTVSFDEVAGQNSNGSKFEANKLTTIQFMIVGGGTFDFWIDDIEFW